MVISGLYDGYSMAATTFLTNPAGKRFLMTVYNSNPVLHGGKQLPPIATIHADIAANGTGGTLMRVLQLYASAGVPLGRVTGVTASLKYVLVCMQYLPQSFEYRQRLLCTLPVAWNASCSCGVRRRGSLFFSQLWTQRGRIRSRCLSLT